MRKLPAAAQEERRRQVVGLRESGLTMAAIARKVGLTENGVSGICRRHAERGLAGLASGPRGPAPGTGRLLSAPQEAEIRDLIHRHMPDELGLPHALWSPAAVRALVERHCGRRLAVRSMGTYLARWGFMARRPPLCWLGQDHPAIAARARREKAAVFRGDGTVLLSDDARGRSHAPRGRTPVADPFCKRAGPGLISVATNKGELRWMVLDGAVKAPVVIRFLECLIRDTGRKVLLILDDLPVYRVRLVRDWLAEHRAEIELFHLPP